MTEAVGAKRVPAGRPRSARIYWVSVLLFAALFAFLTYTFVAEQTPPSQPVVQVRKVIKRRVVTTIVPTPGQNSVSAGPVSSSGYTAGSEPVVTSAS
ncbi:MAG: hypothetical protein ACTHKT_09340 [Solirubrobacterales bacterium]